ncbi:hypothetical protein [Brevibacterium sp. XM4083]|uniref:hypothetical protein n=1 Tax=Brevibacterium sp. XM4083 TaxID=2583238 RepID=UPI0011299BCE|nr:hypothetical protein [Brevibacterium sp. XM4083]MCM1013945.1 hypothetical protein [Brevibacterium sp. XM4083]
MSSETTPPDETSSPDTSPDKSSEPAAAVTKAPQVSTDEDGNTVRGSAAGTDGTTGEHRADAPDSTADDDGLVDVDEVLTGESSDDGPPEMPA